MTSRYFFAFGLALCATVSGATFLGTRVLLDEVRSEDSDRAELIRRLEEKLAALERNDGALDRRLRSLAAARPIATSAASPAASPETTAAPVVDELAAPVIAAYPGAVIDDWNLLSDDERSFLERYPPGEKAILVRGTEGRLGYLRISAKRDGLRADTELDDSNLGLVEELSTAIIDLESAQQAAVAELAARGAGTLCETKDEASVRGQELGSYYMLPVEDRFRVFSAEEVARDPRVERAAALLDRIKSDFGEYTSYVVNWVQPALGTP